MENASSFFLGACAVIMGVGGLFVAAHAGQGVAYYGGLLMSVFCVWFIMQLIKSSGGHGESSGDHG